MLRLKGSLLLSVARVSGFRGLQFVIVSVPLCFVIDYGSGLGRHRCFICLCLVVPIFVRVVAAELLPLIR